MRGQAIPRGTAMASLVRMARRRGHEFVAIPAVLSLAELARLRQGLDVPVARGVPT